MEPTPISKGKNSAQQRAFELIRKHSFRTGDFTLSSGEKSAYYLDMKAILFQPDAIAPLAELVLDKIAKLTPRPVFIGGMELGAVPLISPIVMEAASAKRSWKLPGFFVRKQRKAHGTKRLVEGVEPGDLRDAPVVILDDVTTTGKSVMHAVEAVREEGGRVVLVLSIVDRESGAAQFFAQQSIPFDALFKVSAFLAAAGREAPASRPGKA
jgi:orotate phosphoribosyltransferase